MVMFKSTCEFVRFSLYSCMNRLRIDWNLVCARTPTTSAYSAVMIVWFAVTGDGVAFARFSLKCLKERFSIYWISVSSTG